MKVLAVGTVEKGFLQFNLDHDNGDGLHGTVINISLESLRTDPDAAEALDLIVRALRNAHPGMGLKAA